MDSNILLQSNKIPTDYFIHYNNLKDKIQYDAVSDQLHLLWVKNGVVSLRINNDILHITEGSVVILPFQNVLDFVYGGTSDLIADLFLFDTNKLLNHQLKSIYITKKEKLILEELKAQPIIFKEDNNQDVLASLDLLKYDLTNAPFDIRDTILFIDCARFFNRLCKVESQFTPVFSKLTHDKESNIISKILDYIHENYLTATLTEIALNLHYSPTYLSNLINAKYGTTFSNLLCERRLAVAKKMLVNSDHTLQEICALTGYQSYSGFFRAFIRQYGQSPQEYRQAKNK